MGFYTHIRKVSSFRISSYNSSTYHTVGKFYYPIRHTSTTPNSTTVPLNIILSQKQPQSFLQSLSSLSSDNDRQQWKLSLTNEESKLLSLTNQTIQKRSILSISQLQLYSQKILTYLLPAGYPTTVSSSYIQYASYSSMAMVFSSAGGGKFMDIYV